MLNGFVRALPVCALALVLGVVPAAAQQIGPFTWQLHPYCNIVTLTLTATPTGYVVNGLDDQCGSGQPASVVGMAAFTSGGNVTLNFTEVMAPSGQALHVSASVSPTNGNGLWSDSAGLQGTFAFFAADPGRPQRPLAVSSLGQDTITAFEIAPGAVGASELAPGAVGASALAPGAVGASALALGAVDASALAPGAVGAPALAPGAVGAAALAPGAVGVSAINANQVQARVSGTCVSGQAVVGVNADGSVVCALTTPATVRFRARTAVAVDVPAGQFSGIAFSEVVQNVGGGAYDASTGAYTIPVSGTYLVTGSAQFQVSSSVNGHYCLLVLVSGGLDTQSTCLPQSGALQVPNISTVLLLNAGQAVVLVGINGSSGTQRIAGQAQTSDFTVTRLQ